jgi:hypothetical protein
MDDDLEAIAALKYTSLVEQVSREVTADKRATNAMLAANGAVLSGRRYRADIARQIGAAEKLTRGVKDSWIELYKQKYGKMTSEHARTITAKVDPILARHQNYELQFPGEDMPPGVLKAIRRELASGIESIRADIHRELEIMVREQELRSKSEAM